MKICLFEARAHVVPTLKAILGAMFVVALGGGNSVVHSYSGENHNWINDTLKGQLDPRQQLSKEDHDLLKAGDLHSDSREPMYDIRQKMVIGSPPAANFKNSPPNDAWSDSRFHFDNCAFEDGAKLFQLNYLLAQEYLANDDKTKALYIVGNNLHMVQDFHSHSSWAEDAGVLNKNLPHWTDAQFAPVNPSTEVISNLWDFKSLASLPNPKIWSGNYQDSTHTGYCESYYAKNGIAGVNPHHDQHNADAGWDKKVLKENDGNFIGPLVPGYQTLTFADIGGNGALLASRRVLEKLVGDMTTVQSSWFFDLTTIYSGPKWNLPEAWHTTFVFKNDKARRLYNPILPSTVNLYGETADAALARFTPVLPRGFRITTAAKLGSQQAVFFDGKAGNYSVLNVSPQTWKMSLVSSDQISTRWPDFGGVNGIDHAINWGWNRVLLLKKPSVNGQSGKAYLYDSATNKMVRAEADFKEYCRGLPAGLSLDLILNSGYGQVHVFAGDVHYRCDVGSNLLVATTGISKEPHWSWVKQMY